MSFTASGELLEHSFDFVLKVLGLLEAELKGVRNFPFLVLVQLEENSEVEEA